MNPQAGSASDAPPLTAEQIDVWRANIRASTFANYEFCMGEALAATHPQEAEKRLKQAEQLYPPDPRASLALLDLLSGQGRAAEADAMLATASRRDPLFTLRRLTQSLPEQAPTQPAPLLASLAQLAGKADRPLVDIEWRRAFLLLMQSDLTGAQQLFAAHDPATALWPESLLGFAAHAALAIYGKLDLVAAEIALRQALLLEPLQERLWLAVATMNLGRGDWDGAVAAGDQRARMLPDDAYTQEIPVLALLGQNRLADAEALLDRLIAASPTPGPLKRRRAAIDILAGRVEAAETVLAEGLQELPHDQWMNVDRAILCEMTGRPREADAAIAATTAHYGLPFMARAAMRRPWHAAILAPCLARNGFALPASVMAWLGLAA